METFTMRRRSGQVGNKGLNPTENDPDGLVQSDRVAYVGVTVTCHLHNRCTYEVSK